MKTSIIFHSESGNTEKMAELIAKTMNTFEGIEARTFSITEVDADFIKESKCILIGTPIYSAGATVQIHNLLQNAFKDYEPAGKLGGAFATANYIHGGGDLGIRSILDAMMVRGMLVYSGGAAYGLPVIHLGPVGLGHDLEKTEAIFVEYAKRMAQKSLELFG